MKKIALLATLITLSLPVHAIVNLQDIHTQEIKPGFSGTVGLEFSGTKGNSEKSDTTLASQLQWNNTDYRNILLADYSYGEANQQINSDEAFLHLRHIHHINHHYAWELFGQLQNDRFARLSLRRLVGGGFRHKQDFGDNRYIFGVGAFFEEERLKEDANITTPEERRSNNWRGNLYGITGHTLNDQSRLFSTLYYQPKLSDSGDYRVLLKAGVKVKMAENLNLTIGVDGKYDSQPPLEVKDYDISYRSGIELNF